MIKLIVDSWKSVIDFYNPKNKHWSHVAIAFSPLVSALLGLIGLLLWSNTMSLKTASVVLLLVGAGAIWYAMRCQEQYLLFRSVWQSYKDQSQLEKFSFGSFISIQAKEIKDTAIQKSGQSATYHNAIASMLQTLYEKDRELLMERLSKDDFLIDDYLCLLKLSKTAVITTTKESKSCSEISLSAQVYVLDKMMREIGTGVVDRTVRARLIQTIIQKELKAKTIKNTNIYKLLSDFENAKKAELTQSEVENARLAIELFETMGWGNIVECVKAEVTSFD